MLIKIKDVFGESKEYKGNLKIYRDGNAIEVYFNKSIDGNTDSRKVIVWTGVNAASVEVVLDEVPDKVIEPKIIDPFTKEALDKKPDHKKEDINKEYEEISPTKSKRKRRTKAEIEAEKEFIDLYTKSVSDPLEE